MIIKLSTNSVKNFKEYEMINAKYLRLVRKIKGIKERVNKINEEMFTKMLYF
jgi:hypothetical protein